MMILSLPGYWFRVTVVVLFSGWLLCGGSTAQATTPELKDRDARGVTMVLPFIDMAKAYGLKTSVRNPVTSKVFVTGHIEEDGARWMSNELFRLIAPGTQLTWGTYPEGNFPIEYRANGLEMNHRKKLQELGRQKGADTVMAGYLYAFRDRSGGSYGTEYPAKVIFELVLLRTDTGRIVWQRSFIETQKALSENLFQLGRFIKRKGRWVSAQEMASSALKEMLNTIPHRGPQQEGSP